MEKKVKKLAKTIKEDKKESDMSKLIKELVRKKCRIKSEEFVNTLSLGAGAVECDVIDVDEEWIRFSYTKKKGEKTIAIIRIDSIDSVEEPAAD